MPLNFPRLPRPKLPPNPIRPLKGLIHEGVDQIHKAQDDIRSLTSELRGEEAEEPTGQTSGTRREPPTSAESVEESGTETLSPEPSVSELTTYRYQLERILDDLQHLETEHLPAKGRIAGLACDCIAKASRDLRRHSLETIPIAARQGKDATIFSEMADLASHMVEIGTASAVKSGRYDAEYLEQAGIISNYRKQIETLLSECKECDEMQDLAAFIRERRQHST